jgi:sulfate adenylyltransferase
MTDHLIQPHGGTLVDLIVTPDRAADLKEASRDWPSWDLTERQICDLELLMNGGFSPLSGFMTRADYEPVVEGMRLADGTLWPIPITLDVPEKLAETLEPGSHLALRDPEGVMLAALHVEDVWQPEKASEAKQVFGSSNKEHPAVGYLFKQAHSHYVGGRIEGVDPPVHYDYRRMRRTPAETRKEFAKLGWRKVVAFQTRNPMHRAHQELTLRAAKEVQANLARRQGGAGQPPDPPGCRHDQAGGRGSLHPRSLLPSALAALPA